MKEMTELKTEMEYYKDFCAEFGEKYKEYLEYAKKFADKVQKKHFSIFGVVQTEILPIIFHHRLKKLLHLPVIMLVKLLSWICRSMMNSSCQI